MPAPRKCPLNDFLDLVRQSLKQDSCWGVVLSQPLRLLQTTEAEVLSKLSARPFELSGERQYQLAERRGKQEFHVNLTASELLKRIHEELGARFEQADL
ncbi:MAG: hypothetical protein FD138_1709, partial [Planctomycetota bacterium]